MTYVVKSLASGQLPNPTGVIYTVPAATTTIIKAITVVNTVIGSAVTINLYIRQSGGSLRHIIPFDMSLGATYKMDTGDETYTLSTGDTIEGDCSDINVADYEINGVERI